MQVHIELYGQWVDLQLERKRYITELVKGMQLIVPSRIDAKLCKVSVDRFKDKTVWVELIKQSPTGIFWKLTPDDFEQGVFIIH